MTYDILKFVFYILLCLPVLVIGLYFFVCLIKDNVGIKKFDKQLKEEQRKADEREAFEMKKRQNFYDDYDRSKGYR